jgi:hypothetical protein
MQGGIYDACCCLPMPRAAICTMANCIGARPGGLHHARFTHMRRQSTLRLGGAELGVGGEMSVQGQGAVNGAL